MTTYSRAHPFPSRILERYCLNGEPGSRETWHFVLDLEGSGMTYRPGDCIGILPTNDPNAVERILKGMGLTGDESIDYRGTPMAARQLLLTGTNIATPPKKLLEAVGGVPHDAILALEELVTTHQERCQGPMLLGLLAPLLPRLYSIASSQQVMPHAVELTVARVRYSVEHHKRVGVCSHFLCDLVDDAPVPIYLQPTKHFLLPEEVSRPIIMIGPGTGVAPFRAFMQERASLGAVEGTNWLFFGERNKASDFFYETFWEELVGQGVLKLSCAFSRDQHAKVYVQQRMWEEKELFWGWLERNAIVYVCGDAEHMAKDVDRCLHEIAQACGGMTEEDSRAFIAALRANKRYIRDVY